MSDTPNFIASETDARAQTTVEAEQDFYPKFSKRLVENTTKCRALQKELQDEESRNGYFSYRAQALDHDFMNHYVYTLRSIWPSDGPDRVHFVKRMLADSEVEGKENVLAFLGYHLWRDWITQPKNVRFKKDDTGQVHFAHEQTSIQEFEATRDQVLPLFSVAIQNLDAESASAKESLRVIFESLENIGADEEAKSLILMEDISDEVRLQAVVAHINQFGYVATVDALSRAIKDDTRGVELRKQLTVTYNMIHADEARSISAELSEIYDKIEFSEYALNAQELTRREADLVEEHIRGMKNAEKGTTRILDVGAGTGRHAMELESRGWKSITAVEYQPKHIDYIRRNSKGVRAIQGSWSELDKITDGESSYDCAYILGRSITHNRTPSEMLQCLDQIQNVLIENGRAIVDFEDIEDGARREKVERLTKHLEGLGVNVLQGGQIFDGPNDSDKYDRLILSREQMESASKVLGLRIIEMRRNKVERGGFDDIYYMLEKDPNFNSAEMPSSDFIHHLSVLGLYRSDADFNMYINAWQMTLGQALLYGLSDYEARMRDLGPVSIQFKGSNDGVRMAFSNR